MLRTSLKTLINHCGLDNHRLRILRNVRSLARRNDGTKVVEGKVKTVTCFDEYERIDNYRDFIDNVKKSKLGDELDVEKHFADEDNLGHIVERCEQYYDMHLREEGTHKTFIKREIVKRKYFKLEKETTLLTHAAKEQIRFLHKSNPLEWNYKAIAECFPISEAGAQKLLKSNYSMRDPEKIKEHDKEVAERWKILKSGKHTNLITPLTQKLYKEGKLVDDYFSGNPNLPTAPPNYNVVHVERKKVVGEFSAIVQTYATYEKQKLLKSGKENCYDNQITLKGTNDIETDKNIAIKAIGKFKYAREEFDDDLDEKVYTSQRKNHLDHADLPLPQFKEILKEESKYKLPNNSEYDNILSNNPKSEKLSKTVTDQSNCFLKIEKYEKSKNVSAMYDIEKDVKRVYKYDEKLGYQHPVGKTVKGNIKIPSERYKKGMFYKVGSCIYDDTGKFLYKVLS